MRRDPRLTHTRFAIVTTQRSGSTMLGNTLNTHPDVYCYGEPFQKTTRYPWTFESYARSKRRRGALRKVAPQLLIPRYLEVLQIEAPRSVAIGFKLMYNHRKRHPELIWMLRRRDYRVIHLVRENVLRSHVSAAIASRRGVWAAHETPDAVTISLDTRSLIRDLDRRMANIELHRRLLNRLTTFEVAFERLVADRRATLSAIAEFLGVDAEIELVTTNAPLASGDFSELVENHAEVAATLLGTQYATMMRDS